MAPGAPCIEEAIKTDILWILRIAVTSNFGLTIVCSEGQPMQSKAALDIALMRVPIIGSCAILERLGTSRGVCS